MDTDPTEEFEDIDPDEMDIDMQFRRKSRDVDKRGSRPIENAEDLPLFPTADKKQRDCVSYIKVTKTSRPGNGYKGQLPPTAIEETLLRTFGPGVYTIEGCNDMHRVLATRHELYISGDEYTPTENKKQDNHGGETSADLAIKMANRQAELSLDRQEKTHNTTMKLVTDQSKTTQETLQQFFSKTQESQTLFFTAMQNLNNESKIQQAQMFQQTLALMTAGHNQTMEFLRASNEREREYNNPMMMVQLLMQGLKLGKEFGEDADVDPWVTALKEGGGMLQSIAQIKTGKPMLPHLQNPPQLPKVNSQTGTQPKSKGKSFFSRDELTAVIQLKQKLKENGLELKDILKQVEFVYQSPDEKIPGDETQGEDDFPHEDESRNTNSDDTIGPDDSEQSDDSE